MGINGWKGYTGLSIGVFIFGTMWVFSEGLPPLARLIGGLIFFGSSAFAAITAIKLKRKK